MTLFRKASIHSKLTFVIVCTSVVGLSLASVSFDFYERGNFREAMTRELSALADTLGANTAAALAFYDRKSAQDLLGALRAEDHVVGARLYDSRGQVFAEYRRSGTNGDSSLPPLEESGERFETNYVVLYRAISLGGEKAGTIEIVSDLEAYRARIRQYKEISVVVMLISVLATYLVSSRLLKLVTEPIRNLAQVAARVTQQEDYSLRAVSRGDDEVGALVGSFNQMLERIQERDEALQHANDDLELRVKARTQELQLEVSERLRAEETLSAERKVLRTLIDNVPDFVYVKDAQSRFLVANASVARSIGLETPEELLGKTDFDFFPKELADGYYQDEQNVIRTKQALLNREEECVDAGGNRMWLLTTKVPLYDKLGNVTGIAGIGRDITQRQRIESEKQKAKEALEARTKELQLEVEERVRAQETLSAERQILRALIDNVPDYMYVKDTDCQFLLANASVARQMGATGPEELVGKTDFDFYPRDLATSFFEDEQRVIRTGQAEVNREEAGLDTQGNVTQVLTTQVPLRDKNGHVIGLVGTGHDITALKKIQAEMQKAREVAEAASRAKSEFLANMSHEIRSPLNGVMGMTDLALGTELTAEQREYLETVKMSGDSLLTVINDILDFSKIEAGRIDLEAIDFNLREALEATLKTLALRADEKGLELMCEVAPEVPEIVRGDSSRLRQIVINLVGNAIKFTEVGEVTLKVQAEGSEGKDAFHFTVTDTGIGIPKDKLDVIFDPFSQADTSTTRKYGGTGLGLTISARLVGMMGGRTWVESEEGRGSQFHFTVKLKAADAKAIKVGMAAPPELLRDVRVLVVDDNPTNRRILEGMLARWLMRHKGADGGHAALKELSSAREAGQPYGLILTDMHMPDMDGFELIEEIRRRPELSTATIMMLTSAGHRGDAARCQALGVAAYLLKPIRQSELREAVARVLGAQHPEGAVPLITRFSLQDEREPGTSLKVLLAEDNLVNQRLAVRLLEKRGHRVVVAATGVEALQALEKEKFDIVLMDVQMPEMDGLEATAAIRAKEKLTGTHQQVVALTAHAMKGDREKCLAGGMDGYLSKPIRPQELNQLLERCASGRTLTIDAEEVASEK